jgi:hypothetical protein
MTTKADTPTCLAIQDVIIREMSIRASAETDAWRCRIVHPIHYVLRYRGMAAKYSRHVALTGPLARYVENAAATGAYASAGKIVRADL